MRKGIIHLIIPCLMAGLLSLSACGGGSSSGSPAGGGTTAITGSVFAGPVGGASVVAKDAAGNVIAGPVATDPAGTFSVSVPAASLSAGLTMESTSGTFTDEATGMTTPAGKMSAYAPAGSLTAGASVNIDPSSTIINGLVTKHNKTAADAKTIFNSAFGYTPDTSIAPRNAPSSGTDKSQSLAGLRALAFSQLTKDLGLGPDKQFDLLAAIAQDLADGVLDGKNGAAVVPLGNGVLPEDVQNKFARALATMQANNTANLTGLTADQIGVPPLGKVALTATYRIEYLPGMMAAAQGKTAFKFKVTRRSDGSAASGLNISMMPLMHMSDRQHSTPMGGITDNGDGTYSCTAYYLMASAMNGMSAGFWELKVMAGMSGETAYFYPYVGMAMGAATTRATLKGQTDMVAGMPTPSKRSYYLFSDGATTSSFRLFIAAGETMMSWPALSSGATLHDASGAAWTADPVAVQASFDGNSWISAVDNGGGHWSVSGLTGLVAGQSSTLYIRLSVNGEQKTTDGGAPGSANSYASFTIVP